MGCIQRMGRESSRGETQSGQSGPPAHYFPGISLAFLNPRRPSLGDRKMSKNGMASSKLSRRSLLKSLGAGVAVAAIAPRVTFAADEPGKAKAITVGSGAHTYEWINWGQLPE